MKDHECSIDSSVSLKRWWLNGDLPTFRVCSEPHASCLEMYRFESLHDMHKSLEDYRNKEYIPRSALQPAIKEMKTPIPREEAIESGCKCDVPTALNGEPEP